MSSEANASSVMEPTIPPANQAERALQALSVLATNPDIRAFLDVANENQRLRDELRALDVAWKVCKKETVDLHDATTKSSQQHQVEIRRLQDSKDSLAAELQQEKAKTRRLQEAEETGKKAVVTMKDQAAELKRLRSLAVEMRSLETPEEKKELQSRLERLRSLAGHLAEFWVRQTVLDGPGLTWTRITEHPDVKAKIPLPLCDNRLSQLLRTAAFLAILWDELNEIIFQPAYLNIDDSDLNRTLEALHKKDPAREIYVRSVLVSASRVLGDGVAVDPYVDKVVENMLNHIGGPVPKERRPALQAKLQTFCRIACDTWQYVQEFRDRIAQTGDTECVGAWKPFVLPSEVSSAKANSTTPGASRSNGTTQSGKSSKEPRSPSTMTSQPDTGGSHAVWPAFYPDSPPLTILAQGYVLSYSDIEQGFKEERSAPHRMQRRKARTLSMQGTGADGAGKGTKSFLDAQAGGGRGSS